MPDWKHSRFDDLQDRSPADVAMEWRFARSEMGFSQLGVSRFTYEPDTRFPFGHHHREQEEAYVVVAGSGRVKLDDHLLEVAPGDVLRVGPSVVRQFESGPDGLEVICIGGPRSGDGQRVPDFWE